MADFYPIKLAAIPDGWRLFSVRKIDPAFQLFKKKVLARDQYACQFCGFKAKKYQEVVNLNHNYYNNKLSNLVTACCFCAQCFFLEAVGRDDYGGGILIYLPEISQNDLNGLCHVLFCAMSNVTSYTSDAQEIYRNLKLRSKVVEDALGEGMSDGSLFGRLMIEATEQDRAKIEKDILPHLRLLPLYGNFSNQLKEWSQDALDDLAK